MTRAMIFLLVGLVPAVALANPVFLNPTQTEYKILVTLPNGEKSANTIGKSSQNMAYVSVTTPAAPKFAAEVQDELGTTVWKGQVKDELNYVLAPDGQGGLQVWQAGFYSGRTDVPAACVVNLTGDALKTFDAVGQTGVDAKRGLTFASGFDDKQLFRFHPKERQYALRVTDAQGQVHEVGTYLDPGYFYAIIKDSTGHYLASSAGYLRK